MSERREQRELASIGAFDQGGGCSDVEKLLPILRILIYIRHEAEAFATPPVELINSIDDAIEEARSCMEKRSDAAAVSVHGLN